ncbi:unnamed protein product [Pleuronectes platessa]|uniref:Uncharacterized protein n=1 Tax=Pleuronectes platessa TaxID=8262 RepID=A0A9N7ZDN6_PLEPL|nr:unnamed protein product [Pleuronectes platessa]
MRPRWRGMGKNGRLFPKCQIIAPPRESLRFDLLSSQPGADSLLEPVETCFPLRGPVRRSRGAAVRGEAALWRISRRSPPSGAQRDVEEPTEQENQPLTNNTHTPPTCASPFSLLPLSSPSPLTVSDFLITHHQLQRRGLRANSDFPRCPPACSQRDSPTIGV